ncbi:hypothetical protein IRJ41_021846, partial [Triplophysa rosa]
ILRGVYLRYCVFKFVRMLRDDWRNTSSRSAFLRGDLQPVFRLRRRKLEEIFQEEPQHQVQESAQMIVYCILCLRKPISQENPSMADLKKASVWCSEHSGVLLGSVQLPKVLCMEDQDVSEAMETSQKAEFSEDRIAALEPFSFVFTEIKDMSIP